MHLVAAPQLVLAIARAYQSIVALSDMSGVPLFVWFVVAMARTSWKLDTMPNAFAHDVDVDRMLMFG